MGAVMTLMKKKTTDWASVKKELADPKFFDNILKFDKDHIDS